MGEYRQKSSNWKATSKNKMSRKDYKVAQITDSRKEGKHMLLHANRTCYSHEYILNHDA
jgi:hypothetical protein